MLKDNKKEADQKTIEFFETIRIPSRYLLTGKEPQKSKTENKPNDKVNNLQDNQKIVISNYEDFISNIESILLKRKTALLPKQVNIFSTNYDLFIEESSENFIGIRLNDGFLRTPKIDREYLYLPSTFFDSVFNNGNLYNYRVEIPSINLIKLHGSLNWKEIGENIIYNRDILTVIQNEDPLAALEEISLILPNTKKYKKTTVNRLYYDLLRIYANQLDKENSLLISLGFSFSDEHIKAITLRALKNPTLQLVIFSHSNKSTISYSKIFEKFSNVLIITPKEKSENDFKQFNALINTVCENMNKSEK